MINNIVNEYQNYSYNDGSTISAYLNNMKISGALDENDLNIHEYLLNEVMTLLNKAILNRLSADLLFQNNYWSWGIVTVYYSNFFLSQALNRLKGNFFTFIPSDGRKNIYLALDGKYKLTSDNSRDTHGSVFTKLKNNYSFLLLDSTANKNYLNSILNVQESTIRNIVNYGLSHYRELSCQELKRNFGLEDCHKDYKDSSNTANDEFKLLLINIDRFNLLFHILNQVKDINAVFEIEYNKFVEILNNETSYKFKNNILRNIENKFYTKMNFHTSSIVMEEQLKKAIYEL